MVYNLLWAISIVMFVICTVVGIKKLIKFQKQRETMSSNSILKLYKSILVLIIADYVFLAASRIFDILGDGKIITKYFGFILILQLLLFWPGFYLLYYLKKTYRRRRQVESEKEHPSTKN